MFVSCSSKRGRSIKASIFAEVKGSLGFFFFGDLIQATLRWKRKKWKWDCNWASCRGVSFVHHDNDVQLLSRWIDACPLLSRLDLPLADLIPLLSGSPLWRTSAGSTFPCVCHQFLEYPSSLHAFQSAVSPPYSITERWDETRNENAFFGIFLKKPPK